MNKIENPINIEISNLMNWVYKQRKTTNETLLSCMEVGDRENEMICRGRLALLEKLGIDLLGEEKKI